MKEPEKNIAAKVVGQMGYQVNMYDKWSFLRLTLVWPPMGPPGTVEFASASRKMGKVSKVRAISGMSLRKEEGKIKNDQP